MAKPAHWKQYLLGSLAGQLQLATFLMLLSGFTAASSVGLFMGKRNLFAKEDQLKAESVEHCQHAIATADSDPQLLKERLLFHSTPRTQFWIEHKNGNLLVPEIHGNFSKGDLLMAMGNNPQRIEDQQEFIINNQRALSAQIVQQFNNGSRLWMITDMSQQIKYLNDYLSMMIASWAGCLAITLTAGNRIVKRIVEPLNQLINETDQLTASNLNNTELIIRNAPTEVVQLSKAFNALSNRLALSWSRQREFAGTVSHELRTPLTIVQGYLSRTLRRGENLRESQIKGLQTAEGESIRMRRLLDDLLELSRSDSGKLEIQNQTIRIFDQLSEAIDLARTTFKRDLKLEPQNRQDIKDLTAQADPHRLHQIIFDLLENANKYSADGTPIKLVLRKEQDGVAFDVIDTGIGIPADELEKVFERFQRARNAPHKTGSGLGLSLVKLFVEGMGGSIEVSSRLGEGSCFTVHLSS